MNHALNHPYQNWQNPSPKMGYQVSQTDHAVEKALLKALDYLRTARWSGAETRNWALHIQENTKRKIDGLKQAGPTNTLEKNLRNVSEWDHHIRQTINFYMSESNEMLLKMKLLNPPLTTENIKPFIEGIEKDRLATMELLRPLTLCLDQLVLLKNQLRERSLPFTVYSPLS